MNPEDLGSARIEPDGVFPVSFTGTWTITYTVGRYGIDDGGSIILTRRAMSDATMPQCDDATAPGYVTASTDGDARLRVRYDNRYWIRPWRGSIVVGVYDGSLRPGDEIRVIIGDRSGGSPGWTLQTFPETAHRFRVFVDPFGTREYVPLSEHPTITLVPGEAVKLDAVLPSTARPGEAVPLRIRALDAWDNPLRDFCGEVQVSIVRKDLCHRGHRARRGTQSSLISVAKRKFSAEGWGRVAGEVRFPEEGIHRLSLVCGELKGKSNPICVAPGARPLFWADMHGQTEGTVGTGTVAEYFRFARDGGLMDVSAWQGNDFQVTDAQWEEVCRETKAFHRPGRFVTFLGYEWSGLTPQGGDHNILYLHDDEPIHRSSHWQIHDGSSEDADRYPLSALWDTFAGREDVLVVAHVGGRYANLDFARPGLPGLVEIHSHHGTFEWLAEEALQRGLIVGFVGQSDDHSGRPGLSAPLRSLARDFATFDVYGGYTGIYAGALTREAIWDALKARHCYATTGRRILLDVRCGERMMGDLVRDAEPEFFISIVGTAPILDVEVRRDAEILYRFPFPLDPEDLWVRLEWSGVRIRSRAKKTDWEGTIRVHEGRIEAFRPFAFDQEGEGLSRISETALAIRSTTSGDVDGVFLKISGSEAVLEVDTIPFTGRVKVADLEAVPRIFPTGGVNQEVRCSLCSPKTRPDHLDFHFRDPETLSGRHAYWVKVVQVDGHMAWSSPIFVERRP